jgi:hypothetical protein
MFLAPKTGSVKLKFKYDSETESNYVMKQKWAYK